MSNKRLKKWLVSVLSCTLAILLMISIMMVIVDPCFHYHKPLSCFGYIMDNQRYQNDGIVKHFDYDAIIVGSSMTENFKPSELNSLYGVNAIKVPFSGGSYREVNDLVETALRHNNSVKMVVRGLDYNRLFNTADHRDYDEYPEYLYDKNPINDVFYLLNAELIMTAVQDIIGKDSNGKLRIDFDAYSNWQQYYSFGKEAVDANYARNTLTLPTSQDHVTDEEYNIINENIYQNVIQIAEENPQIDFYYYFTPYSIAYMDYFRFRGELEKQFEAEKYIVNMLLPYENIHIYSFFLEHDVIENLDNYRDVAHHSEGVNSLILQWIHDGRDLLTQQNADEYLEKEKEYYLNFDYESFFADWD